MAVINWHIPPGAKQDWLMGAAATRAERTVMWIGSMAGVGFVVVLWLRGEPGGWSAWQYLLAAVIAWDLFGGAVSNAASSTKRQYFGPDSVATTGFRRVLRNPVAFTALHVYPFLIVALYPGGTWAWACATYLGTLASVAVVELWVPLYLQRPVAMLLFCVLAAGLLGMGAPPGWGWFVIAYPAKLLLAHSVREEPYRPREGT